MGVQDEQDPSRLWKSGLLSTQSVNFKVMVQAAADQEGRPYTDDMLRRVAATPELRDMVTIPANEGIDAVMAALVATRGSELDDMILGAVRAYEPKENG